jgi:peroxiredoxin
MLPIPAMQPMAVASSRTPLPLLPLHGANGGNGSVAASQAPAALQVGDPVPSLSLPDLNGGQVSLADFRGQPLVMLFWNLGCGFCQQMLPDLRNWESSKPDGAPQLLVISTGAVDANRAMELRAPVVLDQMSDIGARFGARGTPMAVLIDEAGNVASSAAAGAPQVFALLDSARKRL